MCGGFAVSCTQQPAPIRSQASYHCGRLTTYLLLGVLAGYTGNALNQIGEQFGLTQIAALCTGILLILTGTCGLLRMKVRVGNGFFHVLQSIRQRFIPDPSRSIAYPFSIGFCSTFLPCGWLYSFVAVAATQPSVPQSMIVMFLFWIGTVPILALIGGISNLIVSPLSRYAPIIGSLLLILAGCFSIRNHLIATEACHPSHHDPESSEFQAQQ